MTPEQAISIQAPGFFGLNKQQSANTLEPGWATEAENCVIDDSGRMGARKGWTQTTTTPITGTPDVEQLFEYINSSGTTETISAAGSKLYSGTTTLTDITGSVTVSDNNWQFQNFNGNVVGFQSGHDPIIYKGSGTFTKLIREGTQWTATTAKGINTSVIPTTDNNLYFEATTSGTTGSTEPTWNTTVGSTTTDGTVTWTTREIVQSNVCLSAFGRLWITDGTVVHYSDLLIGNDFNGQSGGSIDLKSVWVYGMDTVTSIDVFNGYLIIFGNDSIIIYQDPDDTTNMSLVEQISGIGNIARDSIQSIGTDILFLSDTGIRSLQRTIQEKSMPVTDISKNVRDFLMSLVRSEDVDTIRSVYHEPDAMYLLSLPTVGFTFYFDTRRPLEDRALRTTTWVDICPKAMCSTRSDDLLLGQAGVIGTYGGYLDNTDTYLMIFRSTWQNQKTQRIKFPKKIRAIIVGGYGYTIDFYWAFDYADLGYSTQGTTRTNATIAEWGTSEWGVAEWSGGDSLSTVSVQMNRSGEYIQFGWNVKINEQPISFQKVDIYTKLGRYNR